MRILSTAGGAVRHGLGATAEAGLVVAIAATLVFGAAVVTRNDPAGAANVFAAKGGNGGGGGGTAPAEFSTIELDTGSTFAAAQPLARGSSVWFRTNVVGLRGGEYPMVILDCFTDDGTLLYRWLDHPDVEFILGGGWSHWWELNPPPSATCYARLYSYGGKTKGGYDEIRELTDPSLPPLSFHAEG
jgi:hypothetical protein